MKVGRGRDERMIRCQKYAGRQSDRRPARARKAHQGIALFVVVFPVLSDRPLPACRGLAHLERFGKAIPRHRRPICSGPRRGKEPGQTHVCVHAPANVPDIELEAVMSQALHVEALSRHDLVHALLAQGLDVVRAV